MCLFWADFCILENLKNKKLKIDRSNMIQSTAGSYKKKFFQGFGLM